MNKVFLIGNLTREVETGETASGKQYTRFSIAVNRNYKDENGDKITDFFNCTTWGKLAEITAKYCVKGNKVSVVGELQNNQYTDKNGNNRITTNILVSDLELLTPKAEKTEERKEEKPKAKAYNMIQAMRNPEKYGVSDLTPLGEEDNDLPF